MKGNLFILITVFTSILVVILGVFLVSATSPKVLSSNESAKLEPVGELTFDWGDIDINGGNAERVFEFKSAGTGDLQVSGFKTSCACTEALVIINGVAGPVFGMHTSSPWVGTLKPGDAASVRVVFNPLFHGPQALGPVTRYITFSTNDPNNKSVEYTLTGNVVER